MLKIRNLFYLGFFFLNATIFGQYYPPTLHTMQLQVGGDSITISNKFPFLNSQHFIEMDSSKVTTFRFVAFGKIKDKNGEILVQDKAFVPNEWCLNTRKALFYWEYHREKLEILKIYDKKKQIILDAINEPWRLFMIGYSRKGLIYQEPPFYNYQTGGIYLITHNKNVKLKEVLSDTFFNYRPNNNLIDTILFPKQRFYAYCQNNYILVNQIQDSTTAFYNPIDNGDFKFYYKNKLIFTKNSAAVLFVYKGIFFRQEDKIYHFHRKKIRTLIDLKQHHATERIGGFWVNQKYIKILLNDIAAAKILLIFDRKTGTFLKKISFEYEEKAHFEQY